MPDLTLVILQNIEFVDLNFATVFIAGQTLH